MGLFNTGLYKLNSGLMSWLKIDVDALSDEDIDTAARLISCLVGPFSSVDGIPRGGLRLAKALQPFISSTGLHLVIDDVLTSGGSLERYQQQWWDEHPERIQEYNGGLIGAVLFGRGLCPPWVKAVFQCHINIQTALESYS